MAEFIDKRIIPGRDRPGGRRKDHSARRGDYMPPSQVERLRSQGQTTFEDLTQAIQQPAPAIQTDQKLPLASHETPVFGANEPEVQREPEYKTLGLGTKGYDAPPWDKTRSRVFVADRAVAAKVFQRVEDPRDRHKPKNQRRVSIQMEFDGKDEEGRPIRYWVNPKPGGFEGMPSKRVSRPTLKLKTQP